MNPNQAIEILLVEDNPDDLDLTLRALSKARLSNSIHVARDGEQALDFIYRRNEYAAGGGPANPKVILLDLKLPKIDGLEVLRTLKGDAATRTIPVVVLTSSKEQRDIVESYNLGVNSYIVKPVTFEALVDILQTLEKYWFEIVELPPQHDK